MFEQLLINGIITGSIYAIVALGFALVYNTTHIFHVAYAAIYMVSPYFVYTFYSVLQWPLGIAIIMAILLTILISLLVEIIIYQPLIKKRSDPNILLISSLGVMIIVINVVALFYGNETKILNQAISGSTNFGNLLVTYTQLIQLSVSMLVIAGFFILLKYSQLGLAARALRDDAELTEYFGLNIKKQRIYLFILSAFFAATGGILMAWDVGMDPYVGMPMLLNAVVALIIGGVGKFYAPVIGGFMLGILHALTVWQFSANWQDAVTFGVLIIFLLFRPRGLFGEKRRLA
ncbi:MAG: branched-chain amino acid ABC transporter permease [Bacteroidales bacterium]